MYLQHTPQTLCRSGGFKMSNTPTFIKLKDKNGHLTYWDKKESVRMRDHENQEVNKICETSAYRKKPIITGGASFPARKRILSFGNGSIRTHSGRWISMKWRPVLTKERFFSQSWMTLKVVAAHIQAGYLVEPILELKAQSSSFRDPAFYKIESWLLFFASGL